MTRPVVSSLGDFSAQASAYAQARPAYPKAALDRVLDRLALPPGAAVLELGAGTGIFTALLSGRGYRITATDPNDAMRALAPALPDAEFARGTFEHIAAVDDSFAWAVSAQAFHWADHTRALPEIRRVLREHGPLTVLWNDRDIEQSPLLQRTRETIFQYVPGFDEHYRTVDWPERLCSTGDFANVEMFDVRHAVSMDRVRFSNLWRSHNHLAHSAGAQLDDLLLALMRLFDEQATTHVDVPYVCRVFTAWTT